jgi:ABC-type glycerol-3-phosphate transport system substrate-binding protein
MELHPDHYIDYVPSSMFTGAFNEIILARIASGDPPDLILHYSSPVAYAARGACIELDELMDAHPVANKDAFYAGPLSTCNWNGKQWGITVNASEACMYADVDMMEERGLSVSREDFPTTWDDLKELSAEFSAWEGNTLQLAGATPWFADWAWPSMVACNGAQFFDGATNQYNIADERVAEMLEYWLNWIDEQYQGDYGLLSEQHDSWSTYPDSAFALDLQALAIDGLWSLTHVPTEKNYEIYKMPIGPSGTQSKTSVWPNFMFIPTGADNIPEAFEVIAYYSTEGMISWFDRWSDFPTWKDFPRNVAPADLIAMVGEEKAYEWVGFGLDYLGEAVEQWNSPVEDFAVDQIYRAFDQALRKVTPPMQALEEAQELCQEKLQETLETA